MLSYHDISLSMKYQWAWQQGKKALECIKIKDPLAWSKRKRKSAWVCNDSARRGIAAPKCCSAQVLPNRHCSACSKELQCLSSALRREFLIKETVSRILIILDSFLHISVWLNENRQFFINIIEFFLIKALLCCTLCVSQIKFNNVHHLCLSIASSLGLSKTSYLKVIFWTNCYFVIICY